MYRVQSETMHGTEKLRMLGQKARHKSGLLTRLPQPSDVFSQLHSKNCSMSAVGRLVS